MPLGAPSDCSIGCTSAAMDTRIAGAGTGGCQEDSYIRQWHRPPSGPLCGYQQTGGVQWRCSQVRLV